ncbi:MAG: beta-xylosidase [Vicinamibacteria bacterium]
MRARSVFLASAVAFGVASVPALPADEEPFPVSIRVDAARRLGRLHPVWRFFGADEPNYATMKDGRKLLGELGALRPDAVYFRTHNLLTTGDGTPALKWGSTNAYTEDANGQPVYDWTIVDRIFDSYRHASVRPYVEIGFMPKALSTAPEPYRHEWRPGFPYQEIFTGWATPPSNYAKWAELVYQWVKHCVDRYGRSEAETWYWETWNEANIGYWRGTRAEFLKLHDVTVDAVRRVLPTARVGGPDMAGSDPVFLREFLEHSLRGPNLATGGPGTPLDFVSFHAKGAPTVADGHVRMGIADQMRTIDTGFATVASFPELQKTPIVIGESDPEGCAACQGPQLAYRNGTMYSSYTAAALAREHDLADRHGVNLDGVLTWAFEFEDQPYFPGFRALASNGLDLPVLNVFRMFAQMRGDRVVVESSSAVPLEVLLKEGVRGTPDVSAIASVEGGHLGIIVWHYHDDDVAGPEAAVTLDVKGLPRIRGVEHYRVDETHANAYAEWKRMGSPVAPSREQYARLEARGRLAAAEAPTVETWGDGATRLTFRLPRQAVSLFALDTGSPSKP